MKKTIIAVSSVIIVALGVISLVVNLKKDSVAPNISIDDSDIVYSVDCNDKVLLKCVKAVDDVDGDVSSTLEVANRTVVSQESLEIVEYVACDKSGNVGTKKMVFTVGKDKKVGVYDYDEYKVNLDNMEYKVADSGYEGYLSADVAKQEDVVADEQPKDVESNEQIQAAGVTKETSVSENQIKDSTNGSTKNATKDSIIKSSKEPTKETLKESTKEPTVKPTAKPTVKPTVKPTAKPTVKPTQNPVNSKPKIILKTNDITVNRGASSVSYLNCIKQIVDDKDSSEQLFRKVGMTRNLSLRVPGTYTQGLYCVDSDGNRSNVAVITVRVK